MAPRRGTRRLTFRASNGTVSLVRQERLEMVCPPSVGPPPDRATHGGYWVELRDAADEPAFSRVVAPLDGSVEVHSPDGTISREFGPGGTVVDTVFQVLVPDRPDATTLVLVGEPDRAALDAGSDPAAELARFDLGA